MSIQIDCIFRFALPLDQYSSVTLEQRVLRVHVLILCERPSKTSVDRRNVELQTLHDLAAAVYENFVGALLLVVQQIVEVALSTDFL